MTDSSSLTLGVMAAALVVMAAIQVGVVVVGLQLARRWSALADQLERDLKPLVANLTIASEETARAAKLAAVQMERVDRLVEDVGERVGRSAAAIEHAIIAPARQGLALVAGVRAAFGALRDLGDRAGDRSSRADDEDALFIG